MKLLLKSLRKKNNESVESREIDSVKQQGENSVMPKTKFSIKNFINKIKEIKRKATNGEYHNEEEVQKDILLAVKEAEQQIDAENSAIDLANQSELELQQLEENNSGSLLTKLSFAKLKEKSESLLDSFQTKLGKALAKIKNGAGNFKEKFPQFMSNSGKSVAYHGKRLAMRIGLILAGLLFLIIGECGLWVLIAGTILFHVEESKQSELLEELKNTDTYSLQKQLAELDLQLLADDLAAKETIYNYAVGDYSNGLISLIEYNEIAQAYNDAKTKYETTLDYINSDSFTIEILNNCIDGSIENLDQNVQDIITSYQNAEELKDKSCIVQLVGGLIFVFINSWASYFVIPAVGNAFKTATVGFDD